MFIPFDPFPNDPGTPDRHAPDVPRGTTDDQFSLGKQPLRRPTRTGGIETKRNILPAAAKQFAHRLVCRAAAEVALSALRVGRDAV